jgi:hypothetical protein
MCSHLKIFKRSPLSSKRLRRCDIHDVAGPAIFCSASPAPRSHREAL